MNLHTGFLFLILSHVWIGIHCSSQVEQKLTRNAADPYSSPALITIQRLSDVIAINAEAFGGMQVEDLLWLPFVNYFRSNQRVLQWEPFILMLAKLVGRKVIE